MGVRDVVGVDLGALREQDEDVAEALDAEERELAARRQQVEATVALATADVPLAPAVSP